MDLTSITPTPDGLRALSHPVRLQILGLLRIEGSATATSLAHRLGLNSGATSYHLRQLAGHGFILEDPARGSGRERWWQAAHQSTRTRTSEMRTPEEHATLDAFIQAAAVVYTQQLQRAMEERPLLPKAWREASTFSDYELRLTPRRARALVDALQKLMDDYDEDPDDGDSELFTLQLQGFPFPGALAADPDAP